MSFLYKQILVTPCRIKMQNLIFVSFIDDKRIQNPHISQRLFQVVAIFLAQILSEFNDFIKLLIWNLFFLKYTAVFQNRLTPFRFRFLFVLPVRQFPLCLLVLLYQIMTFYLPFPLLPVKFFPFSHPDICRLCPNLCEI